MSDAQVLPMSPNITVPGMVPVDKKDIGVKHCFFIPGKTTTYVMRNGTRVVFKEGIVPGHPEPAFITSIKGYIDELMDSINNGHPELHQKKGLETVTDEQMDALSAVKKKAVEDFLSSTEFKKYVAAQKGVGSPKDSTTEQSTKLGGVANTKSIAAGAASSDSGMPAAIKGLEALQAKIAK